MTDFFKDKVLWRDVASQVISGLILAGIIGGAAAAFNLIPNDAYVQVATWVLTGLSASALLMYLLLDARRSPGDEFSFKPLVFSLSCVALAIAGIVVNSKLA